MAVQDYYFALQNLSKSHKTFGYYSGSADFDYKFDYLTSSAAPGAGDIRLNSGSLLPGSTTNEVDATEIYIDEDDINNNESVIAYLTKLDDLSDKGILHLEVSGSSSYYIDYVIDSIHTSSGVSYMIVSASSATGNVPSGDSNNPISQSYVHNTSSYTTKNRIIASFSGSALRGYRETLVTGSSTNYIIASSGSFGSPSTGSLPAPFNIEWGTPESTFIDPDYYPSNQGFAWLWNDGFKVKHIKMNTISTQGDVLSDFIKHSEWVRFIMYSPTNATGSFIHNANGFFAEDYQLHNVTKYSQQGYSHLFVDQDSEDTSFATDTTRPGNITDTFKATGDYIIYASSSGNEVTPVRSTTVDRSLPQGYFPSSSTGYPTEQDFRGWAGAKYYHKGNLVSTTGILDDPLNSFNTGSTELDKDNLPNYVASTLPFFIDATASYQYIHSSSFVDYNNQTNLIKIGPSFTTINGDEQIYYYKEDTNQIIIRGSEHLDTRKSDNLDYAPLYTVELVSPNNSSVVNYDTGDGFTIPVQPSQSLWLTRGLANIGTQNGNFYKYNRHLHRPYKTYIVTSTGSITIGYGDIDPDSIYGTGSFGPVIRPVGPPPNEFESVYIAYSSSKASDRPEDGLYTFDSSLIETLHITASAKLGYTSVDVIRSSSYGTGSYGSDEFEYGGTGSGDDVLTWQTASLKLYQNSTLLASEDVIVTPTNILYGLSTTLNTTLEPYQVAIGDTLKLSLAVSDEAPGFNSSLIVNEYSMSFGNLVYPASSLSPVTFNNYLETNDGCDPTINNIAADRPNQRLQDVDYSVDISNPINFQQIIEDKAVRATVPESNYTQLGFSNQRYIGSSLTRTEVNEFDEGKIMDIANKQFYTSDISNPDTINRGKGPSIGKIPNVELRNGYIAYFNKIIDPYPNLNGKTAYYVKYLIDESGTIFDPTLSDINYSIFEKTFQLYDYNQKPTNVKVSLQSIEEAKELSKLNQALGSTFKLGEYPTPILYSQTSSLGHTNNIILSGSPFFGTLGIGGGFSNYGANINDKQSQLVFPARTSRGTSFNDLIPNVNNPATVGFDSTGITLFNTSSGIFATGSDQVDSLDYIFFPLDPNTLPPNLANTAGENLSDTYRVEGKFEFFTTTMPAHYERKAGRDNRLKVWDHYRDRKVKTRRGGGGSLADHSTPMRFYLYPYSSTSPGASNFSLDTSNFQINSVTLTILKNPDLSDNTNQTFTTLNIEQNPEGYNQQWKLTNSGFELNPNSLYIEDLIIKTHFNQPNVRDREARYQARGLVGGGWKRESNNKVIGVFGDSIIYKWGVNFTKTNFKQNTGFYIETSGEIKLGVDTGRKEDLFMLVEDNGTEVNQSGHKWARSFSPQNPGFDASPIYSARITSKLAIANNNLNGAVGPFWRRVSGTTDMLFMSSSVLNQAYGIFDEEGNNTNGQYYVQAKLNYEGDTNVVYPETKEPSFTEFDPVIEPWSLKEGDEIRFENKENQVYTIRSVDGRQSIEPPTNPYSNDPENDGLRIIVSPPFEFTGSDGNIQQKEPENLDFFVVRRYIPNKNFIILDQQKPYGFPVSQSSSPGILLPEHRIEKYNRNPDEVLKDLIEKRII